MDGSHWNEMSFFPGEDAEALKTRFVELCAKYPARDPLEITQYIFKDLEQPGRYMQAAALWRIDLALLERISQLRLKGPGVPDASETDLIRRALAVADSAYADKDKIAAIRLAGELQGFVKKSVEGGKPGANDNNSVDFLAELAKRLPN